MNRIKKVLVANRGEIAVRILDCAREIGIPVATVYSEADKDSLHTFLADEAICIGPPPPLESYLNMDRIIEAARKVGANAIHPGYGFLSENPEFAKRCEEEGIIFIGPPSSAIALMGDKLRSRQVMEEAGVPIIPGTTGRALSIEETYREALKIGLPIVVKAAGGGGGKGMRFVCNEEEILPAIESAMRESEKAFGDSRVYIEKFIERPRHIEFQVLVDEMGNAIHLFERECSIQRRHQKIIEETPSTALTPHLRKKMGEFAIRVALAAGYRNAGTVEFLLDEKKNFYFLEMNTRIQVEHPITEMTTGIDIVKWQFMIADGVPIPWNQNEIVKRGHSIECRIYAEDPENNFAPSPGRILLHKEPAGPGIRNDTGIRAGMTITPYYDPILSKVVVYSEDRMDAIRKMKLALSDYSILGIKTQINFLKEVITHTDFIEGRIDTNFIERNFSNYSEGGGIEEKIATLASAIFLFREKEVLPSTGRVDEPLYKELGEWELLKGRR